MCKGRGRRLATPYPKKGMSATHRQGSKPLAYGAPPDRSGVGRAARVALELLIGAALAAGGAGRRVDAGLAEARRAAAHVAQVTVWVRI